MDLHGGVRNFRLAWFVFILFFTVAIAANARQPPRGFIIYRDHLLENYPAQAIQYLEFKRMVIQGNYSAAGYSTLFHLNGGSEQISNMDIVADIDYPSADGSIPDPEVVEQVLEELAALRVRFPAIKQVANAASQWEKLRVAASTPAATGNSLAITQLTLRDGSIFRCQQATLSADVISCVTDSGVTAINWRNLAPSEVAKYFPNHVQPAAAPAANLALNSTAEVSKSAALKKQIDFNGSFLDLLVKLDVEDGVEAGLDPLVMRQGNLAESRRFQSREGDTATEFLQREAVGSGLVVQPVGKYLYLTTVGNLGVRELITVFQSANYTDAMQMASRMPESAGVQSITKLSQLFLDCRSHVAADDAELRQLLADLRDSDRKADFYQTDERDQFGGSTSRSRLGADFAKKREEASKGIVDLLIRSFDYYLTLRKMPYDLSEAAETVPVTTCLISWCEMQGIALDECIGILSQSQAYFRDANAVLSEFRSERARLRNFYEQQKNKESTTLALRDQALRLWTQGKYRDAYATLSAVEVAGDMSEPNVRLGLAVLSTKVKTESVRELPPVPERSACAEILRHVVEDARSCPLGLTAGDIEAFHHWLGGTAKVQAARLEQLYPGRFGVIDGLAVETATGRGIVSPKAVQLLEKPPPPRPRHPRAGPRIRPRTSRATSPGNSQPARPANRSKFMAETSRSMNTLWLRSRIRSDTLPAPGSPTCSSAGGCPSYSIER